MLSHRGRRTVIDIEAGIERSKGELRLTARRRIAAGRSPSGTGDGMEVDVVWESTVRMIREMELDRVALTYPDKLSRHSPPECPECVFHSVGDRQVDLSGFQFDNNLLGLAALDRRRH